MCVFAYYYIFVCMLLYTCPRTAMCVSAYYYIFIRMLLYTCPRTAICVFPYYYIFIRMLLYTCPRNAIHLSACYYIEASSRPNGAYIEASSCPNGACTSCDPLYSSMRTHTIYMSSYYYICVQHQLRRSPFAQHGACTSRDPRL
jgi:hypothetical protein